MKRLFLFFLFLLPFFSWAQKRLNQPDIFFEHLYLPGALHFNSINDITQDSSGLMWFASDNGIYRYDGYELINSNDFTEFQTIKENQVWSVLNVSDNRIFAALKGKKGIFTANNDFSGFRLYTGELSSLDIHKLFYYQNKICFLSKGRGLFVFDEASEKVAPLSSPGPVFSYAISQDTLYVGTYNKIILQHGSLEVSEIKFPELNDYIRCIYKKENILWFATRTHVYKHNIKKGSTEKLFNNQEFHYSQINQLHLDSEGQLWVLTEWNGIFIIDKNNHIRQFEKSYYKKGSLSNNRSNSIYESPNNIIWIGTGAGINKYDRSKRYFSHVNHDPSNPSSLSADLVRGIYEDNDEELLIGTDDGTVNIIDTERKSIRRIALSVGKERLIPFYFVEDKSNTDFYFIGTNNGLIKFNKTNLVTQRLNTPILGGERRVRQMIYYDSLHLLCLSKGHLWFFNVENEEYSIVEPHPKDRLRTLRGNARALYKSSDNTIYVGGVGDLAIFDPKTKEFHSRRIVSVSDEGDSINHMILSIQKYEDKLYIGTFQGGLFVLDVSVPKLKGSLTTLTKNNGLPDNTVYGALKDSHGFIWISTNMGISRFNPQNESFFNYDRDNGLQGEEFNRLAFEVTSRGEFIFGGIEGLNIFFPDKISNQKIISNPILVSVDVINQFSQNGTKKNPRYSIINKEELTLDFDQNYLNFRFTSTNYSQPEKNKFYYKLENYDREWIYSQERSATYTGLAPGKYIFNVKSIAPDGTISDLQASIPVTITTRWWKSWWAGLLFGGIIFGFAAVSFRRRVKKSRAIKSFLENEIERRTKELQESKEELARLNKKKDFIFSILSHDLRSPLTTLKGFLGILVDHFDTLDEKEIKTHAVNIKNSVAKSLDLLDNTLFWSLSQMGDITYTPGPVSVNILFEKIIGLYDLTAQKKNIKLKSHLEQDIMIYVDENMAYITLRNLVSNALKFTPTGKSVKLRAYKSEKFANIIIEDEGKGIRTEDLSKLFDQNQNFMQKGTSNEKGTGLGLILCKKFTEMNKGTISVESIENYGSTFTVKLPLYKKELAAATLNLSKR